MNVEKADPCIVSMNRLARNSTSIANENHLRLAPYSLIEGER
jgi:hypothetical protein